ncbi:MAG TPA: hypothetical protein VGY75_10590 [Candidatus Udaeobacter sp.]|jgi:hypothetical protein|nr:hypothetical protein [Candidatus Udaeobacter sp.]
MNYDDDLYDSVNGMIDDGETDEMILEAHGNEVGEEYLTEMIDEIRNDF